MTGELKGHQNLKDAFAGVSTHDRREMGRLHAPSARPDQSRRRHLRARLRHGGGDGRSRRLGPMRADSNAFIRAANLRFAQRISQTGKEGPK